MNYENDILKDLPLGFSLALAQNLNALDNFAAMPESKQKIVLDKIKHVKSKEEMRSYVNNLNNF